MTGTVRAGNPVQEPECHGLLAAGEPAIGKTPLPFPVLAVRIIRFGRRRRDQFMAGRPPADRIGLPRIAGQGEGLTTATSEIEKTTFTIAAGLGHPLDT